VFRVLLPVMLAALLITGCGGAGHVTITGTDQPNSVPFEDSGTTTATSPEGQVQGPLVEYSIQGGIAGYDSTLVVYSDGRVIYRDRGSKPVRFKVPGSSVRKLRLELEQAKGAESPPPPPPGGSDIIATQLTYMGEEIPAVPPVTEQDSELQRIFLIAFGKRLKSQQ
jgi:hypothetical protein